MIPAMMPSHRPATAKKVYQWTGVGEWKFADQSRALAISTITKMPSRMSPSRVITTRADWTLPVICAPIRFRPSDGQQHDVGPQPSAGTAGMSVSSRPRAT